MSFRESEMARLLTFLLEYCQGLQNPLLVEQVLRKAGELLRRVPLYPGIILSLLPKVISSKTENVVPVEGTIVFVEEAGKKVAGRVQSSAESGILLTEVSILEHRKQYLVQPANIVSAITEDVLETEWPSLVFPEEDVSHGK